MKRKWIKILAAAMCIMMAVPIIGSAAPSLIEWDETCSLTVEVSNNEMAADLATAEIVYDLYKVADMVSDGGYYTYQISETFLNLLDTEFKNKYVDSNGCLIVPRDDGSGNAISSSLWDELAQKMARIALNVPVKDETKETEPGTKEDFPVIGEVVGTITPGTGFAPTQSNLPIKSKDAENTSPSLSAGLYLLIARGKSAGNSYITTIKTAASEEEKIVTVAYTNEYVYTFAPELIALPTKAPENGVVSTANSGGWVYSPTVYLKPEQHARYGSLEIVKDLKTYASIEGQAGEAVFVFQVEATVPDPASNVPDRVKTVYSDVKTLIFNAAGMDSVVIDKIPVGATVTVTEVYSGAIYYLKDIGQARYGVGVKPDGGKSLSYTQTGNKTTREVTGVTIEANQVASVKFTNDYDHRQTRGHGVINSYKYNEGWAQKAEQEYTNPNQAQNNSQQENSNPGEE